MKTPFYSKHIEYGGKIINFFDYDLPIQYQSVVKEVKTVREGVGVFDVSHMGRIRVYGREALRFVDSITTNEVKKLEINQAQYSCMCNENGGIVDDLVIYRRGEEDYLLVVNAVNREKDLRWMKKYKKENVIIEDLTQNLAQLAVQGPKAEEVMSKIITPKLGELKYYWGMECKIGRIKVFLSRTGYTGEDGFELYFEEKYAEEIWDKIFETGRAQGIIPCGLGARDILRLEVRYCLYGNDIDETTNPYEAGLGWIVKLTKGEFVGKEVLERIKKEGRRRGLVCFIVEGKTIPRKGYKILNENQEKIGVVTSGTFSPSINKAIGMGYVEVGYTSISTTLFLQSPQKIDPVIIIKPPFYKEGSVKR